MIGDLRPRAYRPFAVKNSYNAPQALLFTILALSSVSCRKPNHAASPAGDLTAKRKESVSIIDHTLLLSGTCKRALCIVVGERGRIFRSEDRGITWDLTPTPSRSTLTSIFLLDSQLGWAAGHDATLLRTDDGGKTWHQSTHDGPRDIALLDIYFIDRHKGFVIGSFGALGRSNSGGKSWHFTTISENNQSEDADRHLYGITGDRTNQLIVVGESGVVYQSKDRGTTWARQPNQTSASYFGVTRSDTDGFVLYGLGNAMTLWPTDGRPVVKVATSMTTIVSGTRVLGNRIVVIGPRGDALIGRHGSNTFLPRKLPYPGDISAVVAAGSGTILLLGSAGVKRIHRKSLWP